MLLTVPKVLSEAELAGMRDRLSTAPWSDGKITAGHQSVKAKENLQLPEDSVEARELGAVVVRALERSPLFIAAALPRRIFPPLFNRYESGMTFGTHIDNAIRQVPGIANRIRTDVSATLFLSDPASYDGGELVVEDTFGIHNAKPAAGDLVLYPATSLHRVAPVTRGTRLAAFFWIQSMVRSDEERTLLFNLDRAIASLSQAVPNNPELVRLTGVYHNLIRKWGDV